MTYTESSQSFDQPATYATLSVVIDVSGDTRRTVVPDDAEGRHPSSGWLGSAARSVRDRCFRGGAV